MKAIIGTLVPDDSERSPLELELEKAEETIAELEKDLEEANDTINDLEQELKLWKI